MKMFKRNDDVFVFSPPIQGNRFWLAVEQLNMFEVESGEEILFPCNENGNIIQWSGFTMSELKKKFSIKE